MWPLLLVLKDGIQPMAPPMAGVTAGTKSALGAMGGVKVQRQEEK